MKIWNIPHTTIHIQVDWASDSGWCITNNEGYTTHMWFALTTLSHKDHPDIRVIGIYIWKFELKIGWTTK
jgi:hypothetical protein